MRFTKGGQVEVETIIAIVLAFGVLLLVLVQTGQQKEDIKIFEQNDLEKNQCTIISSVISLMNSNNSKETIVIEALSSFEVTGNTVIVGNRNCNFIGQAQAVILLSGSIKIYEQNGVIILENA